MSLPDTVNQEIADTAPIHQTTPAQQDACGKVQHAVMMCHNYDGFPESCNEQPQCKSCPKESGSSSCGPLARIVAPNGSNEVCLTSPNLAHT